MGVAATLANGLVNLGIRKRELGKREEGLESANEAVALYRELSKQRSDVFLPELAIGLSNLSLMYSDLERHEEGLESAKEAVAHSRVTMQSELGKRKEALASAEEAVVLHQRLFLKVPSAFARNFEIARSNYLRCLTALGRSP